MTTKSLRKATSPSKPLRPRNAFRKIASPARRVFLSYNWSDREVAQSFAEPLKSAGFEISNPADSIEPGQNWLLVLGQALRRSDAVVLFLSSAALRSEATIHELDYLLSAKKFKDRVVPVVLSSDVQVPWIVRRLPVVEMRNEPSGDVARAAKAVVRELEHRL